MQERSETPSKQAFEGVKSMTIVNASDIFGKFFWDQFFYSGECHNTNTTLDNVSKHARSSFGQQDIRNEK